MGTCRGGTLPKLSEMPSAQLQRTVTHCSAVMGVTLRVCTCYVWAVCKLSQHACSSYLPTYARDVRVVVRAEDGNRRPVDARSCLLPLLKCCSTVGLRTLKCECFFTLSLLFHSAIWGSFLSLAHVSRAALCCVRRIID